MALTALDARTKAADGEAFGWSGTSTLLQIAPRAFLGDGVIVQPQAPLRVHHQRGTRDAGVRTGRELIAANLAQRNDGSHHAWIETRLPAATRGIAVPLIATSRTREQAPLDAAIEIRAMRGGRRVSIMPDTLTPDDGGEIARYSVAPGKEALHVFVRPAPGWRQDGLLGFRSKDVLPHPELPPPRIVIPSDLTTKVMLR